MNLHQSKVDSLGKFWYKMVEIAGEEDHQKLHWKKWQN